MSFAGGLDGAGVVAPPAGRSRDRVGPPAVPRLAAGHPFAGVDADLVVAAPAKLNLALHVVGRRADGYHLLDSLVAFAMPEDGDAVAVRFGATSEPALAVVGPFAADVPAGADNIAVRAARAVGGIATVTLWKGLPVASGIGGGSADAAAVLRAGAVARGIAAAALADAALAQGIAPAALVDSALARGMAPAALPDPALARRIALAGLADAALALGADVPVCLAGRAARMAGIGERLTGAVLPRAAVVLVNPGVPVATAAVFVGLASRDNPPLPDMPRFADAAALAAWLRGTRNDLAPPAMAIAPAIAEALAAVAATPGCLLARMSGSGATVFGLYAGSAASRRAATALDRPGWWVRAATLTG